jgi:hypothetical protein
LELDRNRRDSVFETTSLNMLLPYQAHFSDLEKLTGVTLAACYEKGVISEILPPPGCRGAAAALQRFCRQSD